MSRSAPVRTILVAAVLLVSAGCGDDTGSKKDVRSPIRDLAGHDGTALDVAPGDGPARDRARDLAKNDRSADDHRIVDSRAKDQAAKDAMPKDAMPKDAMPKDAMPKDAMPKDAMPKDALPKDAMPKDAMPKDAMPKDTMPKDSAVPDALALDQSPPVCNATTCSSGCCQSTTCMPGNTSAACGQGGNDCVGCSAGWICQTGGCVVNPTVLVLGAGATGFLAGEWHPDTATWSTSTPTGAGAKDAPSLAMFANGAKAVAVVRSTSGDSLDWLGWGAGGGWGTALAAIGSTVTTRARPAADATLSASIAQVAFHGSDYKHYYAAWNGTLWSPAADPVGTVQSYGPVAPSLAAHGTDAALGFLNGGDGNKAYDRDRVGGAWQNQTWVGDTGNQFSIAPTITALGSGDMLAWVEGGTNKVWFATRASVGGAWSTQAAILSALTDAPVALIGSSSDALLAFKGPDGHLYWAHWTASSGLWTAVASFSSTVTIASAPALAHGTGGDTAEMAYVDAADGKVYHVRFVSGAPGSATVVGGGALTWVAITAGP